MKTKLNAEKRLIYLLNELVNQPDGHLLYKKFGAQAILRMPKAIAESLEKKYPELGIKPVKGSTDYVITIASLLATITDVLSPGHRLAFTLEGSSNVTLGFTWWTGDPK